MATREELIRRAQNLHVEVTHRTLELAAILSELYDCTDDFAQDCDLVGVKYRKAMYLIEVHCSLVEIGGFPVERLARVGWTKLAILTSAISGVRDVAILTHWVMLAEDNTCAQLRVLVQGRAKDSSVMSFTVSPTEREALNETLMMFGMYRVGSKYMNREAALRAMVRAARDIATWGEVA